MKKIMIIVLMISCIQANLSAQVQDTLINKVRKYISADKKIENINNYDIKQQQKIIDYITAYYDKDPALYLNINNLFRFTYVHFFSSVYITIRRQAANFLLEIYRLYSANSSDENGFWHSDARQSDFDKKTRKRIMDILRAIPLSEKEKDILFKIELNSSKKFYEKDTIFIRDYIKRTQLPIERLRDSIAEAEAITNLINNKPEDYIQPGIALLAAWLGMKEAQPIIEKQMTKTIYESSRELYKLALARLGNKQYEEEILNKPGIEYDFRTLSYLGSRKVLDVIIKACKEYKPPTEEEIRRYFLFPRTYICSFLMFDYDENFILDFPYRIDMDKTEDIISCGLDKEKTDEIIKWLEENKDRIKLNPDVH
jgi:hypothetical protein